MGPLAILWPVFVLVALIYAVWLTLFFQRIRHLKNNPPKAADFATGSAALHYFEPVEMPANNLRNLFEMPVLFLALVPLLLITQMASDIQVGMAWIFVVLRIVHSIIHVRKGSVAWRFRFFLLSWLVLRPMWICFPLVFAIFCAAPCCRKG